MGKVDLNCDMGEGLGNEVQLMPLVTSCNIACGAHAGDENIIRTTIKLAQRHGVLIGAHPSYPDRRNFGRQVMSIPPKALQESLKNQLDLFLRVLQEEKGHLHHIKAHGALYNEIAKHTNLAHIYLDALEAFGEVPIYVPYGSAVAEVAQGRGVPVLWEAFADRNYTEDLGLVSRKRENALIKTPEKVLEHLLSMLQKNQVQTISGKKVRIKADTYCIHGDTPTAFEILTYLHAELAKLNIRISK